MIFSNTEMHVWIRVCKLNLQKYLKSYFFQIQFLRKNLLLNVLLRDNQIRLKTHSTLKCNFGTFPPEIQTNPN